ncbi:MAG: EamA family transporter [Casimicrobiaceae bacterium]
MSGRSVVLTLVCVALIAVGQLLFKSAAGHWRADGFAWETMRGFFSARMMVALAIYAAATVLWVYVLRTVPLSSAYLFFSLAFILVPILAHFAFGEPLRMTTLIGGGLIVAGIVVASR